MTNLNGNGNYSQNSDQTDRKSVNQYRSKHARSKEINENKKAQFEAQLQDNAVEGAKEAVPNLKKKSSSKPSRPYSPAITSFSRMNYGSEPSSPIPNYGYSSPAGQGLTGKIKPYEHFIRQAAARYNLPPELISGIILQESAGNPRARSHCGAMGLMQLMPETAARLGVSNPWDPAQNIDGGAKYIRQMLDIFGRIDHAIAAYNAGPGNVKKYGGIPPFAETQGYVPKVLGYAKSIKTAGVFISTTTSMRA